MKKKRETIQFRIDTELKDQLFREAERMGISPSELIRRLVKMAVEDDTKKILRLEERERDLRVTVIDILKCLQKMSNKKNWEEAKDVFQDSLLPKIMDEELHLYYAKIKRLDLYQKEMDELFGL
ncbi:MAG: ribbon-helix-helix protein, CopG family [Planctomycetes bacterium]|nr:ribbon-helix-helix protein, CopG family [Planctomycetota bacterium]